MQTNQSEPQKGTVEETDCELYDHIPEPYDVAFWHCKVCGKELYFDTLDSLHHLLQKVREEEVRLFMTTMQDRANAIRPNLLLNEIVNYAHDRLKVLNQAELNQDPAHDFFTAPEEVQRPVYERALQKTQEEQEKITNNQTL